MYCPELVSTPFKRCFSVPISDIIFPGIFLAYSKKFDEHFKIKNSNLNYFHIGLISLCIGLFLNVIVYYIYSRPTPSFLNTGLIMLGATLYYAFINEHFDDFLFGFKSTGLRNNIENNNISSINKSLKVKAVIQMNYVLKKKNLFLQKI